MQNRLFLFTVLWVVTAGVAVRADSPSFPPFEGTSKGVYFPGKIIWHELFTAKPDSSIAFYSSLFGWDISPLDESPDYYLATKDGYQVAGFIYREKVSNVSRDSNALWVSFISSPDIDAAVEKSLEHGGTVLVEPKEYPERGRAAIISDCCGNGISGLVASSNGDPGDFRVEMGEWYWNQLVSPDVKGSLDFCKAVFGYEVEEDQRTDRHDDFFLSVDNVTRAGIAPIAEASKDDRAFWIGFVRVANLDSSLEKVKRLGGNIQLNPRLFASGRLAIVTDPEGAALGIIELLDTISESK